LLLLKLVRCSKEKPVICMHWLLWVTIMNCIHRMKWLHSNLWSQYNDSRLRIILCEVKWWRFVMLSD